MNLTKIGVIGMGFVGGAAHDFFSLKNAPIKGYDLYKNSENIYKYLPKNSSKAFDEWKKIISKIKY